MKQTLLILFFLVTVISNSQSKLTDSLISELPNTKIEEDKAKLLNAISDAYKYTNAKEVSNYANKALSISKENNLKAEEGFAYLNLANSNIITGNYNDALNNLHDAKAIFETIENKSDYEKKGLAKAYGTIGIVSSEQSNYVKAFQFYLKAIPEYAALKDDSTLSKLYNNVGVAYKSQNEIDQALIYFNKALTIQEKLNAPNVGITLTNIANCYFEKQEYNTAYKFYTKAKPKVQNDKRALGEWHNNVGLYFKQKGNTIKALENWNLAIETFNSFNDKFGIADTYLFKSELFITQNKFKEAIKNGNLSLQLAKETNVQEQIINSYKLLSVANEKQNNLGNALYYSKLYTIKKDSLVNAKNIRKGVQAEMNFEFEKKESLAKIKREKEDLLQVEKTKQYKTRLQFLALAVLLIIGLGFMYYNKQQLKKRLTLKNELIAYEQKALHLQMNPHFIFNCLGAISGFIINNGTDHAIKYLAKFSKLMRLTLEYSQESLIPVEKEIESLQNYLELEKLRFNDAFTFTITKDKSIEDEVAIPPLLIQPLVENAIIHGIIAKKDKGEININFSLNNELIICKIVDNGIGIDNSIKQKENSVQVHKSMALSIIKKRLKMIANSTNVKASLVSKQNNNASGESLGTEVIITLPIQYLD